MHTRIFQSWQMDIFFALTSAFATAAYYVYVSQTMKQRPGLSSSLILAVSHLSGAAALLPVWVSTSHVVLPVPASAPLLLCLAAGFLVLSRELYFYAYAHTDVANITVFSALTPLYTLGTGYLFLHEVPAPHALLGMLLICASVYALFLPERHSNWRGLAQPFRRIASSKPIFFAFLSTMPTAFAAVFQKQLLGQLDPVSFTFFLLLLIGCMALGFSLFLFGATQCLGTLGKQLRSIPLHFFIISAIMLPVMQLAFSKVMQHHHTAISLVLQRSSIFFQIILAYFYLHERQALAKRVVVGGCIMLGFLLIMLPI